MQANYYKRRLILFSCVFFISLFWMFSLTHNFTLFWEDLTYVNVYNQYLNTPEKYSYQAFFSRFVEVIAAPDQFYETHYSWRQMEELFRSPFVIAVFGLNPIVFRLVKTIIFAGLITLYFAFLCLLCEKTNPKKSFFAKFGIGGHAAIPILLLSYTLLLPEVWMTVLYLVDTLVYTLFFSTLAMLLFYLFYNDDSIKNKFILFTLFLTIVFFTRLSVLTQHVGRINFILFFAFILFTDWKKLLRFRYWSLILVLFCLSFPVLGIFGIFSGKTIFGILGVTEHIGVTEENFFNTALTFSTSIYLTFLPHARFLVLLFFLFFFLHLYAFFVRKKCVSKKIEEHNRPEVSALKKLVIFSLFWFILNAGMVFSARTFMSEPKYFLRFEFSIFLFSQVLFLMSYCRYVHKKYFNSSKILYCAIILFVALSIANNAKNLNEWRGGWGAYFLGYDTVRQYVDEHATGAVLLVSWDHQSPIYFSPVTSTNTHALVEQAQLTNASILRSYAANYSSVYIANRWPLIFNDHRSSNVANLTIVDRSLYGIFKSAIGRYYKKQFYLYEFKGKAGLNKSKTKHNL